ncbi:hypothetical protein GE061_005621 [Apolygus lucorum]|uniref:Uncharacterized protein n=1 Tax=Apolygus lucorum TaxID=248454 RepID=A0A8S9WY60_APOLU|nr:hypothetical protein GE061_005621 [Apolygus lucorum]
MKLSISDEVIGLLTWSSSRNDSKLALVMQIREKGEIPKGQPIKNCHPVGLCSTNTSEAFASADDRRVVRQIRAARQAVDNADIQDGTTSRTTWKGLLFSVSVELQSSSVSEIRKRYNLPTYQNGVNSQFATNGEFNYERLPESGRWGSGVYGSVKGRDGARQPEAAEFSREPYYVPSRGGNQPTNVRGGSNNGNYVPPTLDLSSSFDIRNPWPQNQYGYQYFPPEDIARQPDGPATHQRTVDSKNPINLPPNQNGNQYFPPGDIVRQPADPATHQRTVDSKNPINLPPNQNGNQYFPPGDIVRQPGGPATHQRTVDSKNPINLPPNRNGNQYFPPGDIVRQPADPATYQSGLNNRYPYNSPSNQYQNQYLSQGNVAPQSNQPTTHRNTYKIRLLHNSPQYGDQIPQQNVSIDGLRNRGGGADNIQYPYVTQDSRYDFYRVQLKPHRAVNQTVDSYLNYTNMNSTNGIGQIQSPGFVNTTFPHSSLSNGAASERKRTNCTERNGFCTSKTGDSAIKRLINDLLKNNISEVAQKLAGISSSQMIELIWHLEKATDIASEVQRKVDQSGSSPDFTSDDYLKLLWAVQSVKNSGSRRNNYLRELFNPGKLHGEGGGGRALFEDYDGNSSKLMTIHDRYSVDDDKIFPPEDNEVPPKPNKIAHVQHKSSSRVLLVKSVHQYLLVLTSLTLFL